jgi:hypothetical protein
MNHELKIKWMEKWAKGNGVYLSLEASCGFCRDCVGITSGGLFPDYGIGHGIVWTPEDAYHKHQCVAVLGRGEEAESQLYEWLKWFDDNNFHVKHGVMDAEFDEEEK